MNHKLLKSLNLIFGWALYDVSHEVGFYIDVGANDPERESVTKVFYDHNWHGVNIDASRRWVEILQAERPRDINIFAAVTNHSGEVTFYDQPDGGLGTTVESIADMHHESPRALQLNAVTVPARTLTNICDEHVTGEIHFLKIDVEGGEGAVLEGMDFKRYRPWVLCIECHLPNHPEVQLFEQWEHLVVGADYLFAHTDGFNRFYISKEHEDLMARFIVPFDDYRLYADEREISELKATRDDLQTRIDDLVRELEYARQENIRIRDEGRKGIFAAFKRK